MIQQIKFYAYEIPHVFGNEEREIEINLGEINGDFWGENISMVSAIVGKNGTGKSSILRYIKNSRINTFSYNHENNIIYFSPHLDYIDNYSFDVDPNDISLDTILRRDLENIIDDEKEPNENGWSLNPKQDLEHLNTARQMSFLSSNLREKHSVFSNIFEGLKFEIGTVILRGSNKMEISRDSFHNTPYQFRQIILDILSKCDEEIDKWVGIRRMEGENVLNQHEINTYIFKRNLISSFLTITVNLMERNNTFLSEGVINELEIVDYTAIELFNHFVTNAKVHFNAQSPEKAKHVFNTQVLELFEFIYEIVDEIQDYNSVNNKAFNTEYINLEKIQALQKEIVNHLASNYYNRKVRVSDFLGIKSTDRKLSSGENALLNFYSVIYERVQDIEKEQIQEEYVLLLDEADLGYHPEWKKKFVNSIVKSLPLFFNFSNTQSNIQIIFTTHDPLTLSDIPKQNVVFLDKNDEGQTIISEQNIETFGANVNELLADSFFISDGLMGDFAKEKIKNLISFLTFDTASSDEDKPIGTWDEDSAQQLIEIVGEPVIQQRLQSLFDIKFNISEKEALESKINELQQKLKELNEKNSDR
ncbi:AAA family ATPase [Elizabethkingia anophelis]|nr:AAA family ATPase [Elizabethkingia anophelis]